MGDITITTWIDAPQEVCFDLARDVAAHAESAAFSGERLVAPGRLDGILETGDLVCFEGRHFGMRQRFCARITHVDRPHLFVDEMVEGIFRRLRHDHEFTPSNGGTLMTDRLVWTAPLGLLGTIADSLFLARHMTWFVRTKQSHLKTIAEQRSSRVSS
ncbi:MAG: SRPBCC family protein [Thermoanaerobaculia bacterium]